MIHAAVSKQTQLLEMEGDPENVPQLRSADDDPSSQQFEWVHEGRNFDNIGSSCGEGCRARF
jgi:hypothetical protein